MMTTILAYVFIAALIGIGTSALWTAIISSDSSLEGGARLIGVIMGLGFLFGAYAFAKGAGL